MSDKTYIAIDLKSFYASVECMERGLDPMTTNLVGRRRQQDGENHLPCGISGLKSYGIPGRPRLFEVVQKVKEVNSLRQQKAPGRKLTGSSVQDGELKANPALAVDYVVAPPQMAHYMKISARIYGCISIYRAGRYSCYSIDEVFIDATSYLRTYQLTARELAMKMILDVLDTTGITATAELARTCISVKLRWI